MPSTSIYRFSSRPRPTEHDLDQLASAIRSAAQNRGFPSYVTDRYEAWIFQFLAWCLKVPPYRVHIDRIGGFWKALSCRGDSGMVCEAMDAVSFFFGALDGPEEIFGWDGTSISTDGERTERGSGPSRDGSSMDARPVSSRPNPTLTSVQSDARSEARVSDGPPTTEASAEDLSESLPDGALPDGMDPRSVVPTRTPDRESSAAARSLPEEAPDADSARNSKDGVQRSEKDSRVTLFNPTGSPSNSSPNSARKDTTQNDATREDAQSEDALGENNSGRGASSGRTKNEDPAPGDDKEPQEEEETPSEPRTLWNARREAKSPTSTSNRDSGQASKEQQVSFNVPRAVAERLRDAARRLGLPPGVFAARALDLVCEEVGIDGSSEEDAKSPLEKYQAQLDLLHLGAKEQAKGPSSTTGGEDRRSNDEANGTPPESEDGGSQELGGAQNRRLDAAQNAQGRQGGASIPRGSVGNDGAAGGHPFLASRRRESMR